MKKRKAKKKKVAWKDLARKEKIFVIVLGSTIALLSIVLGYSVYTSFQNKTIASATIGSLNETIDSLSHEKALLIKQRDEFNDTINSLNSQIESLTSQMIELNTQRNNLTLELNSLKSDYNTLSAQLQSCQSDLDACLNP